MVLDWQCALDSPEALRRAPQLTRLCLAGHRAVDVDDQGGLRVRPAAAAEALLQALAAAPALRQVRAAGAAWRCGRAAAEAGGGVRAAAVPCSPAPQLQPRLLPPPNASSAG